MTAPLLHPVRTVAAFAALLALPAALDAQHIALKTVPIPAGEQFLLFPSQNLGMGSLGIALDDRLQDPFANPARGARVGPVRVHALPTLYGEASGLVAGRSLPIAAAVPGQRFFGAFAFALQQIDRPTRWMPFIPDTRVIREDAATNTYAFGSLGTRFNSNRTAVGVSLLHADLRGVDVIPMLYGNSFAIEQDGSMLEARLGFTHDLGRDRTVDVVVLKNNVDLTHDVWYATWTWDGPIPTQPPVLTTWNELNRDETETWGATLRYTASIGGGARAGAILTGNTKKHPHIPNYDLVNIPRDPGNTAAFNIGVGVSNEEGPARMGVELIYEPARSHTWAYADTALTTPGGVIPAGGKTVDNQFRFANWIIGFGVEREGNRHGFQAGMRLRHIRYSLEQQNFMTDVRRRTREDWMEWSPSWSYALKFPEFDLRYTGRFTARGWPDTFGFAVREDALMQPGSPDFLIAPTQPVDLPDFRVTTHRIMLTVPFGR